MGTIEEDEYHPSLGYRTQAHHPSKELLWEKIRGEAWSDAVGMLLVLKELSWILPENRQAWPMKEDGKMLKF